MPDLLHELWEHDDGCGFGRVSACGDASREQIEPGSRFVFAVWASSWREAMRLYEERAYGEFGKRYDYFPDTIYTELDRVEQEAYLRLRPSIR